MYFVRDRNKITMRLVQICSLLFLIPHSVYAGVGDADTRRYVSWSDYPSIVKFDNNFHACTGQYVAPDLILTAGHCISKEIQFIPGIEQYFAYNYKGDLILMEPAHQNLYQGTNDGKNDYILLRVSNEEDFSDAFYDTTEIKQTVNVENLGFGYMRILGAEEIPILRKALKDYSVSVGERVSIKSALDILDSYVSEPLRDKQYRLKADDCYVIYGDDCSELCRTNDARCKTICNGMPIKNSKYFPEVLATTCDSWSGNSGGAYVIYGTNNLVAITSHGIDSFDDKTNTDYGVSVYHFNDKLNELKQKNSITVNPSQPGNSLGYNIIRRPQNMLAYLRLPKLAHNFISPAVADDISVVQNDNVINITVRMNKNEKYFNDNIKNIENLTGREILRLLDNIVEYDALQELREKYLSAREKEQSLANRMLGAAAIGAGGAGGMMMGIGLAEKQADESAERDMRAYLATFTCDYGGGKTVRGGEMGIELPGANILMPLYSEYKSLSESLIERKTALGLTPGIESEVVFDKSGTNLYDDITTGHRDGAYTSISRALQDSESEDAKNWQSQIESDTTKTKVGIGAGTTGVAGGAVGNMIINYVQSKK